MCARFFRSAIFNLSLPLVSVPGRPGLSRIINEVTKSIKNDKRVWYSHEVQTWIRMQWPSGQDDIGVLVVSDDEG